ncbi:hypothetical protein [Lentibacillus jeotgali]|uniref:hypothetical protein n=1 Tax=Lentibacillus jeotgali TaxID=558169 RepID=UPI0002F09675|nr:hypothetical protein [Lentibacillus jeotgali]
MKVENLGNNTINIQASYDEISKIVTALDKVWILNDDEALRQLAYELHNPKVAVIK